MQIRETEKADSSTELRQGDILRIEHSQSGHLPDMGVIINADCDLAHNKTDGVIAYLPIYPFPTFLEHFWIPAYLSNVRTDSTKQVLDLLDLREEEQPSEYENLHSWLATSLPEELAGRLLANGQVKKKNLDALLMHLCRLHTCLNSQARPLEAFASICRNEKDPKAHAEKQITTAKKNMGDGHFFVSDICGCADIGFVIRMRRIYTIDADRCFTSTAAQLASSNGTTTTALRVARFTKLYQFKIAQLFAQQFSKIGLPDEISELSDLAIADLVSKITKGS